MACTIDFRCLNEEFGGKTYKRKRQPPANDLSSMHIDPNSNPNLLPLSPSKRIAVPSIDDLDQPSPALAAAGAPTYDSVIAGRVSERKWKQPRKNQTSAVRVSAAKKSYEERQKERELKAYREGKEELKEEIWRDKEEKRKRREKMKKKEENISRLGTKLQRISNPNTLKKLAKSKQRKLLKVVPDEVFNKGKGQK